jgi:glycosyltransferase involved in cell wall biosynthesis
MATETLRVLLLSPMAPSPPRFGAQARTHGLLTNLARRYEITAVIVHDDDDTPQSSAAAMRSYCKEVHFIRNPHGASGWRRRALQLRSWFSRESYQRLNSMVPGLQNRLDQILAERHFDVVFVNFPHLAHYGLRRSPPGAPRPVVIIDSHDVHYDLARQIAVSTASFGRRLHARLNWRKLKREEVAAYESVDGVCVCSVADQQRLAKDAPAARTVVIPNAADIEGLQPRPSDPVPDANTVLFFGLLATVPNVDGLLYFVREIWPRILAGRPAAKFLVVGANPAPELRALEGSGVSIVGPVDDLRPYLSRAAVVVVPLRLGSGTRLKILESWAMARPVVSTSLGAEGLESIAGRHLLIADDPDQFAAAVLRVLNEPELAAQLGAAGRALVSESYSWQGTAEFLAAFFRQAVTHRDGSTAQIRVDAGG